MFKCDFFCYALVDFCLLGDFVCLFVFLLDFLVGIERKNMNLGHRGIWLEEWKM